MFTDSHCHLYKEYYNNIENIVTNAQNNNIRKMINCATNSENAKEVLTLSKKYPHIYAAIGVHPEDIDNIEIDDLSFIVKNIENIVAIGEIGLDYHYNSFNKIKQQLIFEEQLKIAQAYKKPVIIHSRDATSDTIEIIKKYKDLKGIIHCFTGSYETAQEYIKIGYKIGIGGVLTFKNSKLYEVVKRLKPEDIVLETDSPYMTPEPYRGKTNEPKHIYDIAKKVCDIMNIDIDELSKITEKNIKAIFDI